MNRQIVNCLTVCLFLVITVGCNIFDFSDDEGATPTERAEKYIRQGQYTKAKQSLSHSVRDSVDSEILYLKAKATLLDSGFDIVQIVSHIGLQDPVPGLKLAILEFVDEFTDGKKTKLFLSNIEVAILLKRIWLEKTFGMFTKDDITIDYILANMMTGILKIRDPNGDYVIDYRDFQLDMSFFQKTGGYTTSGYGIDGAKIKDMSGNIVVNDQGLPVILNGLTAFLGGWGGLAPGLDPTYQPDDINTWLSSTLSSFSTTDALLKDLMHHGGDVSYDVEELVQYNSQLAGSLNNYWYDDSIDNDGDGSVDEEIINGEDDDLDGLVDEDTAHDSHDPTPDTNTDHYPLFEQWVGKP